VPVDFRTFGTDRDDGDGARWHVAVSHYHSSGSPTPPAATAPRSRAPFSLTTPTSNLSVFTYLPETEFGGVVFAGQKLSLKGVHEDTVGLPIRQPLDWASEVDMPLRAAGGGFVFVLDAASAYDICLVFFQVPV
jgi:hypothetical protein